MLTIAMVATIGATTTVSTSAEGTKDIRGTIYFDSSNLRGATKDGLMYCYTWSDIDGGMFGWDSAECKMTNIDDFYYSYDVPSKNSKGVEVEANLMIFHARGGNQTYDLTFDDSCMGDTAYAWYDSSDMGCPSDDLITAPARCSWRENRENGAHISINSLGKIKGVSLTKNETPESVVDAFIANYKAGMEAGKTGYDNPELVTDENRTKLIEEINRIIAEQLIEPTAPTEDSEIEAGPHPWDSVWLKIPSFWKTKEDEYFVHLWNVEEENMYGWDTEGSRLSLMKDDRTTAYFYWDKYDFDKWNTMCFSNGAGKCTLSVAFDADTVMGSTLTIKETVYESLSKEPIYEIVREGEVLTERQLYFGDSIGVIGEKCLFGRDDKVIFDRFCEKYGPKSDGSCYWNEAMSEKYGMDWEKAKKYVMGILVFNEGYDPELPTEDLTAPLPEIPTATETENPTSNTTTTATTAPTAPTTATSKATATSTTATATSTNNSNGAVNTAQASPLTALAATFIASLGVAFAINRKRELN